MFLRVGIGVSSLLLRQRYVIWGKTDLLMVTLWTTTRDGNEGPRSFSR